MREARKSIRATQQTVAHKELSGKWLGGKNKKSFDFQRILHHDLF